MFGGSDEDSQIYDIDRRLKELAGKTHNMLGNRGAVDESEIAIIDAVADDFDNSKRGGGPPRKKTQSRSAYFQQSQAAVPANFDADEFTEPQKKYVTGRVSTNASLNGYEEIPRAQWDAISKGSFIRYLKRDGTMVRGGILLGHLMQGSKHMFRLQFPTAEGKSFCVYHDNIMAVYKKGVGKEPIVAVEPMVQRQVGSSVVQVPPPTDVVSEVGDRLLFGNGAAKLEDRVERLEKQVAKLKNLMRIIHDRILGSGSGAGHGGF